MNSVNYETPHYVIFSLLLLLSICKVQMFPSLLPFQTSEIIAANKSKFCDPHEQN
jgi:hypothetical protein